MPQFTRAVMVLASLLALAAGCGGDGGGDSGPSPRQIFLVQRSADASGAVSQTLEAASEGILASDSNSSAPGPHAVPVFPGATPAFDFAADVDVVFDFDALDADGNDRFPNASGQIHVTATGTQTGTPEAGDASFSATVATESDVVVTNPDTGTETTIPSGASWSYLLTVVWTMTDSENWTVEATSTTNVDVQNVIVDDGVTPLTIDVLGQREVVSSFTRTAGKLTHARSFEGSLTTTVDDGSTTETVVIVFDKPGKVRISVLGHVFGPMSEGQVLALFHTVIN